MNLSKSLVPILVLCLISISTQAQSGKVGIGTDSPGSLLHLFSTENSSIGLSIESSGLLSGQQSYLELITIGDGTAKLGLPGNKGWHLTARSAAYGNISQRHDLLLSRWNGVEWKEMMFFDTTGNIGIGMSNPTSALEIQGELELGLNTYSIIKTRSDTAQIQLQSSLTPYNGAYVLMNSGERPDDAGSIYITHGNFTGPAPESLIRFRYADNGVISNQLVINSDGNLGLGTSSPASLLQLYNTQNTSKGISIGSSGTLPNQQTYLEFITKGDGAAKLGQPNNIGWHFTARSASYGGVPQQHDLLLSHWNGDDWREMMFFDTSGFVGIGTSSPKAKLHLLNGSGSGDPTNTHVDAIIQDEYAYLEFSGEKFGGITFKDDNVSIHSGVVYNYQDDKLQFRVGNADFLSLDESGNLGLILGGKIGIGTTTPAFPLDVSTSTELRSGYFYNTTNSTQTTFGLYSGAYGAGSGKKRGGSFESVGGSGENIGVRGIASDGSTNIAVYGSANGGTTNWAGYFNDGNVYLKNRLGIGNTAPLFPIDIATSTDLRAGYFYNTNNTSQTTYGVWGGAYGGGSGAKRGGGFEASGGSGENIGMRAIAINGSSNIGVYGAASGGSTNWAGYFNQGNVYIDNNLGIGTTSPGQKLHISGGDIEVNDGFPWIYLDATTSTGNSGIYFQNQNSTRASIVYNKNSNYLVLQNETNNHYVALDNDGVGINTLSPDFDIHITGDDVNDIAEFYNKNTGTNADVLRAKVNRTTPTASQYFFRVVGGDNGSDGGVRSDGSGGTYYATASDRRLKMNIRNISNGLEILGNVQPRSYEMKQAPGILQYGFIAQELKKTYPVAVVGDENSDSDIEPMMIDYARLTPLLASATKELHQVVKDQQAEIDQLKQELAEIKELLKKK